MKPVLENRALTVAARLLVGTIFLFASIDKVADPDAFAAMIDNYRILPSSIGLSVASFLPWVELTAGLLLILGLFHRGTSLIIGFLTAIFTVAVISGILRDLDISCGCFTLDPDVSKIGWRKVGENTGIIVLSAFLMYSRAHSWSLRDLADPTESGN